MFVIDLSPDSIKYGAQFGHSASLIKIEFNESSQTGRKHKKIMINCRE